LPRQAGRQRRRGQTALEKTDASIATKELSCFGSDLPPKCYICREREREREVIDHQLKMALRVQPFGAT